MSGVNVSRGTGDAACVAATPARFIIIAVNEQERAVFTHWALSESLRPVFCSTWAQVGADLVAEDAALVVVAAEEPDFRMFDRLTRLRQACPRLTIVCLIEPRHANAVLTCGATDFASRPYQISELLNRLGARARRGDEDEPAPDTLGRSSGVVRLQGRTLVLRAAARRILDYLCEHAGRAVPVAELQDRVLHMKGRSHTVHNHVYEIRRALKEVGVPNFIQTHKGAGCFSVPTHVVEGLRLAGKRRAG